MRKVSFGDLTGPEGPKVPKAPTPEEVLFDYLQPIGGLEQFNMVYEIPWGNNIARAAITIENKLLVEIPATYKLLEENEVPGFTLLQGDTIRDWRLLFDGPTNNSPLDEIIETKKLTRN